MIIVNNLLTEADMQSCTDSNNPPSSIWNQNWTSLHGIFAFITIVLIFLLPFRLQ